MQLLSSKPFVRWWSDTKRWSPRSILQTQWAAKGELVSMGDLLTRRIEPLKRKTQSLEGLTPITIHFDGEIVPRDLRGKEEMKGRLFRMHAGDLVFSKIDVRNGAVGILPKAIETGVVTAEYPVYEVTGNVDPRFNGALIRTRYLRDEINSMVSGTSGRKRLAPEEFEQIQVPRPPEKLQKKLADQFEQAMREADDLDVQADKIPLEAEKRFLAGLGIKHVAIAPGPKTFVIGYGKSDRWAYEYNRLVFHGFEPEPKGKYPCEKVSEVAKVVYGFQLCPERRPRDNPRPYLRVANVQRNRLDLRVMKEMEVSPKELEAYRLLPGDVLLCEGNSAELVGRGAIWRGEIEDCVHQNHILRVRAKDGRVHQQLPRPGLLPQQGEADDEPGIDQRERGVGDAGAAAATEDPGEADPGHLGRREGRGEAPRRSRGKAKGRHHRVRESTYRGGDSVASTNSLTPESVEVSLPLLTAVTERVRSVHAPPRSGIQEVEP